MTNDNTRTKANAVFFSVLMVISMVAVGFAAAPAAAVESGDSVSVDEITLTSSAAEATGVTYTVDFNVSGNANSNVNATYVSISSSDVDLSGVTNSDLTAPGTPTVYDASADQLIINMSSPQMLAQSGNSHTVAVAGLTNPSAGSYNLDLGLHSDNGSGAPVTTGSGVITATGSFETSYTTGSAQRSPGEDEVFNGTNVFQGEDDLTFINNDGSTLDASDLEGTSGNREGTPLRLPIPQNADTGSYDTNGPGTAPAFGVTVVEPTITTAEVQLNGDDLSTVGPDNAGSLDIAAEWNFNEAEDLSLTVEDPSGTDITSEVVTGPETLSGNGEQTSRLDLNGEDAGEYTVIFEGADDLDYDAVVEEYTIELTNDDTLSINTASDSVTQGTNLQYTVSGGTNGQYHMVTIDEQYFRSDSISNVFRNVGDTSAVGFANDSGATGLTPENASYAYAVVEIDGTEGVGSIRTSALDDTSVTLDVYGTQSSGSFSSVSGQDSEDDTDFSVESGDITIGSPTGEYTIGSEVDINGTATSADNVDIYVRDNNAWELLYSGISVDSADEYEQEDITLTSTGQSNPGESLINQAGTYRYGVVDASESNGQDTLTTTEFSRASSTSQSLRTVEGELNAQLETINGQINYDLDNQADISGSAEGQSSIALIFVDRRGNLVAQEVDVDSDGTIDEEDVTIPNRAGVNSRLSEGTVTAHFISQSRDDVIGDSDIPGQGGNDVTALKNWVNQNLSNTNLNANQVRDRIVSETTEDTASDDLMVTQTFRYAESQTTIDSVYPEEAQAEGVNPVATGETMVVSGSTNLRADDNSITVEVLNEDGESLEISSTDEWETDGQWNATVDTSNLEPGTYTVESDDSTNTDRAEVEIVEERQTDDGTDDGSGDGSGDSSGDGSGDSSGDGSGDSSGDGSGDSSGDGSGDSSGDGSGDSSGDGSGDSSGDGSGDSTDDGTPGFGALVALVALIAAALLATRRNN
ncbi:HVO_2072 family ArtA-dependent S-layer glycoprotein [Halorubrum sp. AJ67]|uniref:HVO_2072 family ArtA-dependent S-layer glycoprotein n=1 Tax=Halorubrum sp. AJ67 TaxID=1173487 RepID=UPI000AC6F98B|nr:HVO_2072 family ArtA-dependent S-layer glycoprotein [Halorubrum sp. AJ67]